MNVTPTLALVLLTVWLGLLTALVIKWWKRHG